jgi:hypothetical protein
MRFWAEKVLGGVKYAPAKLCFAGAYSYPYHKYFKVVFSFIDIIIESERSETSLLLGWYIRDFSAWLLRAVASNGAK